MKKIAVIKDAARVTIGKQGRGLEGLYGSFNRAVWG
jgi:hypothetical protein